MEAWIEWARGPAFLFSFTFMVAGLLRHVVITAWEMRKTMQRAGDKTVPYSAALTATFKWLFPVGKMKHQLLFSLTSFAFHVGILIVPIFLAGHIVLWGRGLGIQWPPISNELADVLTILVMIAAVGLVVQRLSARATRALSRPQDYLLPLAIAVPFASGFLLMHATYNPFSYAVTFLVHILSANLVLVLIPITKLSHAVLMPSSQLVAEMGWKWPADAGSKAAVALHKEEEPV